MNNQFSHIKRTALVSALMLATGAQTATINVDGTTCILADAITAANTNAVVGGCTTGAGDDVLELELAGSPFTQNTALPQIISNVTINGNGATVERDSGAAEFPVIYINSGANVILNDMTITGGASVFSVNFGGGVKVQNGSAVEINDSIISGNIGGAVWMQQTTGSSINNSVVENNTSNPSAFYTALIVL